MTDFSVVRQLIGTRSPIRKSGFSVASQLSGTRSPESMSDLCVSPQDKHIAYLLHIVYAENFKYATSLQNFNILVVLYKNANTEETVMKNEDHTAISGKYSCVVFSSFVRSGSISRVMSLDDHLSRPAVANGFKRPT